MGDKEHEFVSEFDEMTTTDRIRMLKAALPYVDMSMQKYMAIYIKLLELMYIFNYFRNEPQKFSARFSKCKSNDPREVMNGLKKYCSKSEQASVDQILQMMQAFEMYQKYSALMQPLAAMNAGASDSCGDTFSDACGDTFSGASSGSCGGSSSDSCGGPYSNSCGGSSFGATFGSCGGSSDPCGQASSAANDPLASFMGMLSPEQRKMFEMFKEM